MADFVVVDASNGMEYGMLVEVEYEHDVAGNAMEGGGYKERTPNRLTANFLLPYVENNKIRAAGGPQL